MEARLDPCPTKDPHSPAWSGVQVVFEMDLAESFITSYEMRTSLDFCGFLIEGEVLPSVFYSGS
jgi:hypothetical protein